MQKQQCFPTFIQLAKIDNINLRKLRTVCKLAQGRKYEYRLHFLIVEIPSSLIENCSIKQESMLQEKSPPAGVHFRLTFKNGEE